MPQLTLSTLRRKLVQTLNPPRFDQFESIPLPSDRGRPRILYFLVAYPNFSETYMHEEIRSLSEDYDIRVVTYRGSERPRARAWQHDLVPYKAPCLVYSDIDQINLDFDSPEQRDFLRQLDPIIKSFRPDLLHGHYLGIGVLLKTLAERYEIPFTLRTHSMDILSEPDTKLDAYCEVINTPWCKRVLAFPASVRRLRSHGLQADKLTSSWPIIRFEDFYKPEPRPVTGRVLCAGPAIKKKAHRAFIDLAVLMRGSGYEFDLYGMGPSIGATAAYNEQQGNVVNIRYADPEAMPDVYPRYDWLVYPSDPAINKVGLPVGIVEAQASGIGVCWQELPERREEQLDFLGGGGFLFKSIDELPAILTQGYPGEMREQGFVAARRCDIQGQRHLLTDVWESHCQNPDALAH